MSPKYLSVRFVALALAGSALACGNTPTSPEGAPPPSLAVVAVDVVGVGGPFSGAVVKAGSYCTLGKRNQMEARLYWDTGAAKVQSFLLWLDGPNGSRELTRKVLGSPRTSGVAAGFEYQKNGPWTQVRLELFAGAPDYTAPRTRITVPCS
jgi:hypothetical protein